VKLLIEQLKPNDLRNYFFIDNNWQ